MVEVLERQPQFVHLLMALPALGGARDHLPLPQRAVRVVGDHRRHVDWQVGHATAQQPLAHPAAAADDVVMKIRGPGHVPTRLHQDAGAVALRRAAVLQCQRTELPKQRLAAAESVERACRAKQLVGSIRLGRRQQLLEHIPVLGQNAQHQDIGIADVLPRIVVDAAPGLVIGQRVFENFRSAVVVEVFAEEPQHARLARFWVPPEFVARPRRLPLSKSACPRRRQPKG